MKTKYAILAAAVIILVIAVTLVWFNSEGVHQLLFLKYAQTEQRCYILDPASGELLGESILTVDGTVNYLTNSFRGTIYVEALPIPLDEAEVRKDNHTVIPLWDAQSVHYTGNKLIQESRSLEFSRYTYQMIFYGPGDKWIGLIVYDESETYVVVCAESFEMAIERNEVFNAELHNE